MPRGSKPGERRGGRKKGTPNHASIARQEAVASTGLTPLDLMIEAMRYYRGLAGKHAPVGGSEPDPKLFEKYMDAATAIAKDAAPYVHPRLASVVVQKKPWDLSKLTDAELAQLQRLHHRAAASGPARAGDETTRH